MRGCYLARMDSDPKGGVEAPSVQTVLILPMMLLTGIVDEVLNRHSEGARPPSARKPVGGSVRRARRSRQHACPMTVRRGWRCLLHDAAEILDLDLRPKD